MLGRSVALLSFCGLPLQVLDPCRIWDHKAQANIGDVNFDEPASFDVGELVKCLENLRDGKYAHVPVYDFVTSSRSAHQVRTVSPCDVVILEGILVLHLKETLELCNMKIFVDTDDDVRLARRIKRDTVERGRNVEGVIRQYTRFVKPSFERYILPSKNNADIIIPWRENNDVAVDLITQNIRSKLGMHDLRRIYTNLHVMPATMQTRGMHTKIRSRATPRQELARGCDLCYFQASPTQPGPCKILDTQVFYADRLIRLVVEQALGYLPFSEAEVTTPAAGQLKVSITIRVRSELARSVASEAAPSPLQLIKTRKL